MYCAECNREITETSKFCNFCGARQIKNAVQGRERIPLKKYEDYELEEFISLTNDDKRKVIINEISQYGEDYWWHLYLKEVILYNFDIGLYAGDKEKKLFEDLSGFDIDPDQKELFLRNRYRKRNTPIKRYLKIVSNQTIIYLLINFLIVVYLNANNFSLFEDANFIVAYIFISLTSWISSQIFLLPWNIAWARRHPSAWGILVINLLLSWTFIAWIIALIWALSQTEQRIVIRD